MSDLALQYYNSVDTLELQDLEILSEKITALIFKKKANDGKSIDAGLDFFNSVKGSVKREIDAESELTSALKEKYENLD